MKKRKKGEERRGISPRVNKVKGRGRFLLKRIKNTEKRGWKKYL